MKKFLLTTLAALFAVVSFAQVGSLKQPYLLSSQANVVRTSTPNSLKPATMVNSVPSHKMVVGQKNLRRAAIGSIDELQGDFIVANYDYDYDSEADSIVADVPSRSAAVASIEVVDDKTVKIYGLSQWSDEGVAVTATVDVENGTLTIPVGQKVGTNETYGDISIQNASTEGDLTATIFAGGIISIDQYWFESVVYQESNVRWASYHQSIIAPANGIMEYHSDDAEGDVAQNVLIVQNPDTKVLTVWNFHNFITGEVADIDVAADKTFMIEGGTQVVYMHSQLKEVYLWGSPKAGSISDITGKIIDNVKLVAETGIGYVNAEYRGWVYPNDKFTITLIDGSEIEYPALETGELVTAPEGLVTKEYPLSASAWYNAAQVAQGAYASTVKIGWNGTSEVYFQGLDKDLPEAWVKGTLSEDGKTIAIPVTYMGIFDGAVHYLGAYGLTGPRTLNLDYDADADTYSYGATVMIYKGAATTSFAYFMNGFFIGAKPSPTTAPEGLVTVDMPFKGSKYVGEAEEPVETTGTVKVGRDGQDVYIQNLFSEVADGWLKGVAVTIEGQDYVIFPKNQYVGNLSNALSAYLVGYMSGEEGQSGSAYDVVFSYNAEKNYYVANNPVILTRFKDSYSSYESFFQSGLTIGVNPDEGTDGIKSVAADGKTDGSWYTMNGVRIVKPAQKGIYIHNGKKVVLK